jgi:myo-inositol-1(or 4)-monophosphatase
LPARDLPLLIDAARAAGEIATPYWRKDPTTWEKRDSAGPVTEADLAVDAMLKSRLLTARPDHGWLSEETEDGPARLTLDSVFIVDPIDGTRAFIAGESTWAHSLAVARGGQITAGVVFLPARDLLYAAAIGDGATLNGRPIRASATTHLEGATVLSNRASFLPEHWPGGVPPVERHFRPSLAYRLSLVAEGRFDAMLTLGNAWEWDIAAGCLICTEAGARVTDRHGARPEFNNSHPKVPGLIVASDPLQRDLLARLHP